MNIDILNVSGCILIHEGFILINCLLMMVKWSVSGWTAGVADGPGPRRPDPESSGSCSPRPPSYFVSSSTSCRICLSSPRIISHHLSSCLSSPRIISHHLSSPGIVTLCGWAQSRKVSLGETRERTMEPWSFEGAYLAIKLLWLFKISNMLC